MLPRIFAAAFVTLGLSSSAFANCHCSGQTAYSISQDKGVTVMRGNIPKMHNPKRALIAQRKAAEVRAEKAERRAKIAKRQAVQAGSELERRPAADHHHYYDRAARHNSSPYNSGFYGYGASVSAPLHRARGNRRGVRGQGRISRPVFSTRIRG